MPEFVPQFLVSPRNLFTKVSSLLFCAACSAVCISLCFLYLLVFSTLAAHFCICFLASVCVCVCVCVLHFQSILLCCVCVIKMVKMLSSFDCILSICSALSTQGSGFAPSWKFVHSKMNAQIIKLQKISPLSYMRDWTYRTQPTLQHLACHSCKFTKVT